MKYENKIQVTQIISKIEKAEDKLGEYQFASTIQVLDGRGRISDSIELDDTSNRAMSLANVFIDAVKVAIKKDIDAMKAELETL